MIIRPEDLASDEADIRYHDIRHVYEADGSQGERIDTFTRCVNTYSRVLFNAPLDKSFIEHIPRFHEPRCLQMEHRGILIRLMEACKPRPDHTVLGDLHVFLHQVIYRESLDRSRHTYELLFYPTDADKAEHAIVFVADGFNGAERRVDCYRTDDHQDNFCIVKT